MRSPRKAATDPNRRLEAIEMLEAELKTGVELADGIALEVGCLLALVLQVGEAAAGAGTFPVLTGDAPLGPAGTRPTVWVAPSAVSVLVTKVTWGTVTVRVP